jgi:purine-nucleoside phosphorylase
MIAVTFALPAESSAFVRRLRIAKREGAIVGGRLADCSTEVCVLHTGVGASECRKRLAPFLQNNKPQLLLSSGFCGGTNDDIGPGDLIIGQNFSDVALVRTAETKLKQAKQGKLFSADHVVDPATDRYAIGRDHGAIAIDMESETIAQICAAGNTPMLSLRVVSDSPAAPFPVPPEVLFDVRAQRTKFARLFVHLARQPLAAVRLGRFSKQIAFAREKLAEAISTVIQVL